MKKEVLDRANDLSREIKDLDMMVFCFDRTWAVRLTVKTPKLILHSVAYGAFEGHDIICDKELGDRIKQVVREYKAEKELELEELI
jgi:hypothetical protein